METKRRFLVSISGYRFETESEDWEGKSAKQITEAIISKSEKYMKLFGLDVRSIEIVEIGDVRPQEKKF